MELQPLLFLVFALGAVISAVSTVTRKNPVSSAMSLVAHFFMLAGLYLTLEAQFVAAVQVLVYAGAIMVLVVFVIMLLNLGNEQALTENRGLRSTLATLIGAVFAVQIILVTVAEPTGANALPSRAVEIGTTESIGQSLFTQYLFPFEAISLLLLAALIGSVVLAKRHMK
ncbi:MAG TPA: NADH-quinone oxidoreductase subunit J [Bacteroidetes bacterium]|nr:NADH-quinone oxidoreductase subunit J [Bacteroidota bacterium]HRK04107.1 NADH-quinone oxidoreductase subunit J [Chlorobiota bacterium]